MTIPVTLPLMLFLADGGLVEIPLVTFDGVKETTRQWERSDDSMMGGSSFGTFQGGNGSAIFEGECHAVPTPAKAPGWMSFQTKPSNIPPVNGCQGLKITARTNTHYAGFRLSFGTDKFYSREGYKASFRVPAGSGFSSVKLSWYDFTRAWDDTTGQPTIKCTEDTGVCPTFLTLNNMQRMQVWAEGVVGKFHLEIQAISAYDCAAGVLLTV